MHWNPQQNSLDKDRAKLRERPDLLIYWFQIMTSFAVTGTNIMVPYKPSRPYEVLLMEQIAYAMEIHAIAHEYGHNHCGHGRNISENLMLTEFEADAFATRVSATLELKNSEIWNPYLGSGAGASVLLRSLDLLRHRTDAITQNHRIDRESHPDIKARIEKFERLGMLEPDKFKAYLTFRGAVTRIFDAIDAELRDMYYVVPEKYLGQLRDYRKKAYPPEKPNFL